MRSVWLRRFDIEHLSKLKDNNNEQGIKDFFSKLKKRWKIDTLIFQMDKEWMYEDMGIFNYAKGFDFYVSPEIRVKRHNQSGQVIKLIRKLKKLYNNDGLFRRKNFKGWILDYIRFEIPKFERIYNLDSTIVAGIAGVVKQSFKNKQVGCTIFANYIEALKLGQNPKEWKKVGVDFIMPMCYAQAWGIPKWLANFWLRIIMRLYGGMIKTIPILQAYYDKHENPLKERPYTYYTIHEQEKTCKDYTSDVSFYRASTLLSLMLKG